MCYQLHFNIGVNKVLLQSFLLSFGLTYGQENNHNQYMYSGYLSMEPCLLAHGCAQYHTSYNSITLSMGLHRVSTSMATPP